MRLGGILRKLTKEIEALQVEKRCQFFNIIGSDGELMQFTCIKAKSSLAEGEKKGKVKQSTWEMYSNPFQTYPLAQYPHSPFAFQVETEAKDACIVLISLFLLFHQMKILYLLLEL